MTSIHSLLVNKIGETFSTDPVTKQKILRTSAIGLIVTTVGFIALNCLNMSGITPIPTALYSRYILVTLKWGSYLSAGTLIVCRFGLASTKTTVKVKLTIRSFFEDLNKKTGKGKLFKYITNLPEDADVTDLQVIISGEAHHNEICRKYFTQVVSGLAQPNNIFFSEATGSEKDKGDANSADEHVDITYLPKEIQYRSWDIERYKKHKWEYIFKVILIFIFKEILNKINENKHTKKNIITSVLEKIFNYFKPNENISSEYIRDLIGEVLGIHKDLVECYPRTHLVNVVEIDNTEKLFYDSIVLSAFFESTTDANTSEMWLSRQDKMVENLQTALMEGQRAFVCAGITHVIDKNRKIDKVIEKFFNETNSKYLVVFFDSGIPTLNDRYAMASELERLGMKPVMELIEKAITPLNSLYSRLRKQKAFQMVINEIIRSDTEVVLQKYRSKIADVSKKVTLLGELAVFGE